MLTCIVNHGATQLQVDIDVTETVGFLKFQLYSLTDIEPEKQHVYIYTPLGVLLKNKLSNELPLSSLQLTSDHYITVSAVALTPSSMPLAFAPPNDWQSICSRIYLGSTKTLQPAATANGRTICAACASSCHLPQAIRPVLQVTPTTCECSLLPDHFCLFSERSARGTEEVNREHNPTLLMTLAASNEKQINQILSQSSKQMSDRIHSSLQQALQYEDISLQQQALQVIPVSDLQAMAERSLSNPTDKQQGLALQDHLLIALLHWFKHEFFVWVNAPPCQGCGSPTEGIGGSAPTPEEARHGAGRVETYKCSTGGACAVITRFPRYNNPGKLLETRRGRCGEWANCFTLCCRAVGLEARLVSDWTDHVWTEVYSDKLRKWVHTDCCENARDEPLLYEKGWGKKLNYAIAFSADEIVDVSKRYTHSWHSPGGVLSRRVLCTEPWLSQLLVSLNLSRRVLQRSPARLDELARRRIQEEHEFVRNERLSLPEEEQKEEEQKEAQAQAIANSALPGRQTGSLAWRQARGEVGINGSAMTEAGGSSAGNTLISAGGGSAGPLSAQQLEGIKKALQILQSTAALSSSSSASSSPTVASMLASASSAGTVPVPSTPIPSNTATPPLSASIASPNITSSKAQQQSLTKKIFQAYYEQITVGCGKASPCENTYCFLSPSFDLSNLLQAVSSPSKIATAASTDPVADANVSSVVALSAADKAQCCLKLTATYQAKKLCPSLQEKLI